VPPAKPGQYAPRAYPAWSDLEKAVNTTLPTALNVIHAAQQGTIRKLIHKRRKR
jgi:hypothetical protein